MDLFTQAAERIIQQQEAIIGPLALEQARKVVGLIINPPSSKVEIEGNKTEVLQHLVEQYSKIFGQTSVEVCKLATADIMKKVDSDQVPQLLR